MCSKRKVLQISSNSQTTDSTTLPNQETKKIDVIWCIKPIAILHSYKNRTHKFLSKYVYLVFYYHCQLSYYNNFFLSFQADFTYPGIVIIPVSYSVCVCVCVRECVRACVRVCVSFCKNVCSWVAKIPKKISRYFSPPILTFILKVKFMVLYLFCE